jgi:diguanylate cyclase (GGDEF)-like protein
MHQSLVGRWLDQLERWSHSPLTGDRRRFRIIIVGVVGGSYLVDTLLLGLFCLAGTVDLRVPVVYGCAAAVHVLLFASLHWTGVSDSCRNAHLTVWQMTYAIALQLVVMTISPQITTFFLAIIFLIFGFGTLRIGLREALLVWLCAVAAIAVTLNLFAHASLGIAFPNAAELVIVAVSYASILLRSIGLGYCATALRMRMSEKASSLEQAIDRAEHLATHDALTGALNRRAILPAIAEHISLCERKGTPACVAMLDIDRFKEINDGWGHLVGDAILRNLARQITCTIRPSDKLARYGGDEFILLLAATGIDDAVKLLERIRAEVAVADWGEVPAGAGTTLSGGVTQVSASDMFIDVITRADRALYDAKSGGRNRVCRRDLMLDSASGDAGTPARAADQAPVID